MTSFDAQPELLRLLKTYPNRIIAAGLGRIVVSHETFRATELGWATHRLVDVTTIAPHLRQGHLASLNHSKMTYTADNNIQGLWQQTWIFQPNRRLVDSSTAIISLVDGCGVSVRSVIGSLENGITDVTRSDGAISQSTELHSRLALQTVRAAIEHVLNFPSDITTPLRAAQLPLL
jgi:hypothetical protein